MDRLPTGGVPLGYSMMKGQIPFHEGFPLTYSKPQKNVGEVDQKISLKDALAFVTPDDVLSYYKGVQKDVLNTAAGDSHVLRRAAQGEIKARITLAVIAAFEEAANLSEWRQGNGHVASPEYRAHLLSGMIYIFGRLGYLPHDESYETQPGFITSDQLKLVEKGDTPSGRWRKVWSYAKDLSDLTPTSSEVSHTVRYEQVFCRGFSLCYATGSASAGTEKWHMLGDTDGNLGFFRENIDVPGNYALDYSFSQNLKDHEEQIITTTITIAELVVDVYTGGAAAPIFAKVNTILFPFVHAMCSGDASDLLNSTISMAQDLAMQGATLAAKDFSRSQFAIDLQKQGGKTFDFFVAKVDAAGNLIEGVGASMAKVVAQAQKMAAGELGVLEANQKGLLSGLPFGKQMLSAAHLLGSRAIGNAENQFRAITAEVQDAVRSSAGVGGWAHDIGAAIDFKSVVGKIPPEKFTDDFVRNALHNALEKTIKDSGAPAYCHEAIYTGAAWQVLLLAQTGELVSTSGPALREYAQSKVAYQQGFVPDELKAAYAASGQKFVPISAPAGVAALLAKPNPGIISGQMTTMSAKAMLAANAGVTLSDIGPSKSDLLIAFGISGLGLGLAAKVTGKTLPLWAVAAGAAGMAGAYAYFARNTVMAPPISVATREPPTLMSLQNKGIASAYFQGLAPQFVLAAMPATSSATTTLAKARLSAAALSASAPITSGYKKTFVNAAGGAATGQSTKNLVLLQDGAHKFTVAEVQYLLGLWGAKPKPTINGVWSDETVLAVRDYQTRAFQADKLFSLADVTGNPFDDKTSAQLRRFAKTLLTSPSKGHTITVEEAQAILGLKITGAEDAATQAKLKAAFMGPIATAATQAWLRNLAGGAVAEFV